MAARFLGGLSFDFGQLENFLNFWKFQLLAEHPYEVKFLCELGQNLERYF